MDLEEAFKAGPRPPIRRIPAMLAWIESLPESRQEIVWAMIRDVKWTSPHLYEIFQENGLDDDKVKFATFAKWRVANAHIG